MSPDLKDVLIATIPSILPGVLVGIGILLNKSDINNVRADIARIDGRIDRIDGRIDRIDGRIDALSKQLGDAVLTLTGIGNDLDKRISRLEKS